MQATLIIANYNGRDLLAKSVPAALEAAHRAGGHPVVVADDGSSDDSAELVRSAHPQAGWLGLPHRGFAATCNSAVAAAETEAVVLLNSDVVVSPDFLPPLLDDLTWWGVFAVGPRFLNPDGALRDVLGNRTSCGWHRGLLEIHHETNPDYLGATCAQLYANGAAMAFSREKWLSLGGFDALYRPFYWEDVDLGFRAWRRAWRVLYEPSSVVVHDQGSTVKRTHRVPYVELMSAKNAVLFSWKNLLDPELLRRTLAAQVRWAADDVLIGEPPSRTRALRAALRQVREAAAGRARERRERVFSDRDILAACGAAL